MDREIKRLLKLSKIPNFRMSEHEMKELEEWKRRQELIEIEQEESTPKKRTYTRRKKTTNEVKEEDKETGKLEVVVPEES